MSKTRIKDTYTPEGKKFLAEIDKLSKMQVRAGLTEQKMGFGKLHEAVTADDVDGITLADMAMFNELGTVNSPPRPFLRQSVDNNRAEIRAMAAAQLQAIVEGGTAERDLINRFNKATGQSIVFTEAVKPGSGMVDPWLIKGN
jgi:hypothetical protein